MNKKQSIIIFFVLLFTSFATSAFWILFYEVWNKPETPQNIELDFFI